MPKQGTCDRCGYISSQGLCKACVMLEGLNKGKTQLHKYFISHYIANRISNSISSVLYFRNASSW
jgi:hypothetical protein